MWRDIWDISAEYQTLPTTYNKMQDHFLNLVTFLIFINYISYHIYEGGYFWDINACFNVNNI